MRYLAKLNWAVLALAIGAVPAGAQTIGGGSSTGGSGGGGGTGGSGGGGGSSGTNEPAALVTLPTTPAILGASAYNSTTSATNTAINASNPFRATFANPYYQGRAGATLTQAPGGFGIVLYNTGGATGGGNIGSASSNVSGGFGGVTGSSSSTGGRAGGTTGASSFGGGGTGSIGGTGSSFGAGGGGVTGSAGRTGGTTGGATSASVSGQIVPLPRQIAYQGFLKFQPAPVIASQLQSDLRGMIDRSTMIANPQNVDVQMDGRGVILRGAVKDDDEARMIEGMVRLTPGVQYVQNQLSYPRP